MRKERKSVCAGCGKEIEIETGNNLCGCGGDIVKYRRTLISFEEFLTWKYGKKSEKEIQEKVNEERYFEEFKVFCINYRMNFWVIILYNVPEGNVPEIELEKVCFKDIVEEKEMLTKWKLKKNVKYRIQNEEKQGVIIGYDRVMNSGYVVYETIIVNVAGKYTSCSIDFLSC